jgi:citrate synthase
MLYHGPYSSTGDVDMRQTKPLKSDMGFGTSDRCVVRGHDLCTELLGKLNLGDMAYLEVAGRMPTPQESNVFNALLLTLVEHGMTPMAMATRLVYLGAPEAIQGAVAAGLNGMGNVFGGGSEAAARVLSEALKDKPADTDLAALAVSIVEDHARRKAPVAMSRCWSMLPPPPKHVRSAICRSTPPAQSVR